MCSRAAASRTTKQSRDDFLKRFHAKCFEEHLKQRGDRPQQHPVEFSFHDVVVAELVEIQAEHVEQSVGDQREAVEKQHFLEAPAA